MAKSVLVVEDEPNIVLSLENVIKKAGYEVRVVRDGEVKSAGEVRLDGKKNDRMAFQTEAAH